jgi:hydrogenase expression/formation protein HypC
LDEESAQQSLLLYRQMGALEEEFGDAWGIAARQAGESRPPGTALPGSAEEVAG